MKPLDLTKPVQTRGGSNARIICTNAEGGDYPVVSLVHCSGQEIVYKHTLEGFYSKNSPGSPADLVNVQEEQQQTGWVNCYPNRLCMHSTRGDADRQRSADCVACVPITITFKEGDGL